MEITVVLYATLGRYHPQLKGVEPFKVQLPEGATVQHLLEHLGIAKGEVKQVVIGHRSCTEGCFLQEGQRVAIFPPIAGG